MEEPVSTMKVMTNSAVTALFLMVVKDATSVLHAMEIRVIMVVHARLFLRLILSWVWSTISRRFTLPLNNIILKPDKIFECSCADGLTGDFCEFKTEQDHLLFVYENHPLAFNANGRLIEENAVIDQEAGAYYSCSTMLNGEAIIFGGLYSNFYRQVHLK